MTIERTLSIIKPDATRRNITGAINERLERGGLRIIAQKRIQLSQGQAERFYEVHAGRPFYRDLVAFMSSGPVLVQVLEGENAVALNREIMGATDPANAAPGTICSPALRLSGTTRKIFHHRDTEAQRKLF